MLMKTIFSTQISLLSAYLLQHTKGTKIPGVVWFSLPLNYLSFSSASSPLPTFWVKSKVRASNSWPGVQSTAVCGRTVKHAQFRTNSHCDPRAYHVGTHGDITFPGAPLRRSRQCPSGSQAGPHFPAALEAAPEPPARLRRAAAAQAPHGPSPRPATPRR